MVQYYVFPAMRTLKISGHSIASHQTGLETVIARAKDAIPITKVCTCGAVTVEALGGARHVFTCHCTVCAEQTQSMGGKAPTWTAVSRSECTIKGEYKIYTSSITGRRGKCATCDDALFMDYSAKSTFYVANAKPTPSILANSNTAFTADADIYWNNRKPDALRTAPVQFDEMPLGPMGFVADPGRKLKELEACRISIRIE